MSRSGRYRHPMKRIGGGGTQFGARLRAYRKFGPSSRARAMYASRYRVEMFRGRYAGNKGPELKFHDLDIDDAVVAAGGTIAQASCNLIAQGVTESARIGRKCLVKQINWRFQINLPEVDAGGTPQDSDVIRVILYLDKQCNGAAAAVTDIVESANFQSFNNLSNKSRFRTLMDRTYEISPNGVGGNGTAVDSGGANVTDTLFKSVNIPVEFNAATGAITEIRSNNIGVLLLGFAGVSGFFSKMRLRFSDL